MAVTFESLPAERITAELLRGFRRRQIVTQCLRRTDGGWAARDIAFVDDWTDADRARVLNKLRAIASSGGVVLAALDGGALAGFAALRADRLGPNGEDVELASLHVSEERRRQGLGRALFHRAADWARAQGAKALYISAHSAVESQAFYRAMGCVDARVPDPAHAAAEPCDRQMEYLLPAGHIEEGACP